MPGVTREQIEQARRMTAIEYLLKYESYDMKRCGRGEYELRSHDSFKINEETSKWHWKSRDIGGVSALDFLIHVRNQPFLDTVRQLCDEHPCFDPVIIPEKPKKVFALPDSAPDCDRAVSYLRGRGISLNVLAFCREQGLFYEDIPFHNVVFVARDSVGTPRFACKRGTWGDFKVDVEGSEKRFGCYMRPESESDIVAVYESIIDSMSHTTLDEQDGLPWKDKYRLALGGIYAPDPNKVTTIRRPVKPPVALEQFLLDHPHIRRMEICTDNDFAGRYAANRIKELYQEKYEVEITLPVTDGFDYNDMAVARMELKGRQRTAER
jgi:hypothetical protein